MSDIIVEEREIDASSLNRYILELTKCYNLETKLLPSFEQVMNIVHEEDQEDLWAVVQNVGSSSNSSFLISVCTLENVRIRKCTLENQYFNLHYYEGL